MTGFELAADADPVQGLGQEQGAGRDPDETDLARGL